MLSSRLDHSASVSHGSPVEQPIERAKAVVSLANITKDFGATLANSEINLEVLQGDVIGLVGGNGAGKSTLMRILCGAVPPTLGSICFGSDEVSFTEYTTSDAQHRGIRMVHQEFSLCTNLSVAENFFVEQSSDAKLTPTWRNLYRERAHAALESVFPNSGIDVNSKVGDLSIGGRQMVEIARAAATPEVKLIILDEPTSSLDAERSLQLRSFVHKRRAEGIAFIFISHKLQEIVDIATKVMVLRSGKLAWSGSSNEVSIDRLVDFMGGHNDVLKHKEEVVTQAQGHPVVTISGHYTQALGRDIDLYEGEIVGLAGLEGCGQNQLLHAIFTTTPNKKNGVLRNEAASFIAGDRRKEGVFQLSTVLFNMSIGRVAKRGLLSRVSEHEEAKVLANYAADLKLDEARFQCNILELSGGNQQKALVARALANETQILLLDDPTRGVDISTKQDFYRLCAQAAESGKTLIWHTTEDAELLTADRVLVFSGGQIVSELKGKDISEEAIVHASFTNIDDTKQANQAATRLNGMGNKLMKATPFIALLAVLVTMISSNPLMGTSFGLDLLLMPALPLVLVTIAQMYIVGGSEIDLGVGAFAGLVSVLSATILYSSFSLGFLAIAAVIVGYAITGWLIQARNIPAIVVTLGASFIWVGIGYTVQSTPGGASPEWLSTMVNWSIGGLPTSVLMIIAVTAIGYFINRLPIGVALRGFGNNKIAMVNSGWSATRMALVRYAIAGFFAAAAGLSLTAINTASDINSGSSYTLLSIAAVVMGGCTLIGGIISPLGAIAGAVTLALLGAMLGTLNVSSDFYIAAQGLVLIAFLALQVVENKKESNE